MGLPLLLLRMIRKMRWQASIIIFWYLPVAVLCTVDSLGNELLFLYYAYKMETTIFPDRPPNIATGCQPRVCNFAEFLKHISFPAQTLQLPANLETHWPVLAHVTGTHLTQYGFTKYWPFEIHSSITLAIYADPRNPFNTQTGKKPTPGAAPVVQIVTNTVQECRNEASTKNILPPAYVPPGPAAQPVLPSEEMSERERFALNYNRAMESLGRGLEQRIKENFAGLLLDVMDLFARPNGWTIRTQAVVQPHGATYHEIDVANSLRQSSTNSNRLAKTTKWKQMDNFINNYFTKKLKINTDFPVVAGTRKVFPRVYSQGKAHEKIIDSHGDQLMRMVDTHFC